MPEKQKAGREIANSFIDDINQTLGTHGKYHSTPIQTVGGSADAEPNLSIVYTMHHLPAKQLFNIMILENITKEIRAAGGFFNNAKELSLKENSVFTFSMSPEKTRILYYM